MPIDLSKYIPGTKTGQNNFLGVTLPDTGFTESRWNTGKYSSKSPQVNSNIGTKYAGTRTGQILGATDTKSDGYGGAGNGYQSPSPAQDWEEDVDDGADDEGKAAKKAHEAMLKQIDSEFNSIMGTLNNQEASLNEQLPLTEQQIQGSYGDTRGAIEYEQGTRVADLQGQQATAEGQTAGIMNQARRTYNELQSGASKFGGSAAQAYGELLGRSTAETMGTAQNELAKTVTGIQSEMGRVKNFYQQKLTDLNKNMNLAVEQARKDFRDQVAAINSDRTKAQNWKASQNVNALANFKQQVASIRSAANAAKQAIDMWNVNRNDALAKAKQEKIEQYKLSLTDVNNIGKGVATMSGNNLNGSQIAQLYGLQGQNSNEVDWTKYLGGIQAAPVKGMEDDLVDENSWMN